jgi:hypothetical protein
MWFLSRDGLTIRSLFAYQVMLDTVGPELQVVNKSETPISLEENDTVVLMFSPLTGAKKPPPACCPSTSLDSPRLAPTDDHALTTKFRFFFCSMHYAAVMSFD